MPYNIIIIYNIKESMQFDRLHTSAPEPLTLRWHWKHQILSPDVRFQTLRSALLPLHTHNNPLYPLPEQHIIFKQMIQSACVFQPCKIWAHRTSNQNILLKVHTQTVVVKKLFQDWLKAERLLTDIDNLFRNFQHFIDVVLSKAGNLLRGSGMRRNKHSCLHSFYHLKRL